jgi:hypothetical protein
MFVFVVGIRRLGGHAFATHVWPRLAYVVLQQVATDL